VTVSATDNLVHLPFADRIEYGSPYPEGIAVGHLDAVGDASGGSVVGSMQADGGFLYRLELLNATKSTTTTAIAHYITAHRWATDRSGLGAQAFDLNGIAEQFITSTFSAYSLRDVDYQQLRRFPMGRTDRVLTQVLTSFTFEGNENTTVYDIDWMFTSWPTTALYRPGFLASFWESPFVPTFL